MQVVKGQTYDHQRVPIDGIRFEGCTFDRTKLIFSASDTVSFDSCTFIACTWVFEGSALITLQLLSAMNRGLGIEGERLVDSIVDGIRRNEIGKSLFEPEVAAVA